MTSAQIEQASLAAAGGWFQRLERAINNNEPATQRLFFAEAARDQLANYARELRERLGQRDG